MGPVLDYHRDVGQHKLPDKEVDDIQAKFSELREIHGPMRPYLSVFVDDLNSASETDVPGVK